MSPIAARKLPAAPPKRRKTAEAPGVRTQRDARQRSYNWRRRMIVGRRVLMGLMVAAAGYGGWFVWQQGHTSQIGMIVSTMMQEVPTIPTLRVAKVEISGTENISRGTIRKAMGDINGMPILGVPLDNIRADIMALGWVEDASVLRTLPGTIRVRISERQPYAIWQYEGVLRLIDRTGTEILRHDVSAYDGLPLIVGQGAPQHAAMLMDVLRQEPALWSRVRAIIRVGDRRWDLQFANGIEVMLPELDVEQAWLLLAELEATHAILSRDIALLDMRLPDRLVVRPGARRSPSQQNKNERI
ncbi:MAG: FtsQ-type POTRA domain-containing protein [Alphaproteobacteria bacterium]|nr:MAG: FtsQ-type POTRA domain-containing protein [Alphaproteobacteria bacterium]